MKDLVIVSGTDFGLDIEKAKEIELGFYPSLQKMNDLKPLFDSVVSKEITPAVCAEAKAVRLQFVKCRTDTAKIHKAFKGFYLAGGRFVDAWKNKQTEVSEQIEAKLEEIEKHFEIIEQRKK